MFVRTTVVLLLATAALAQVPTFGPFERNHFTPDPGPTTSAGLADVDGDGDLDALFVGATLLCYRNDGHAVFTAVPLQLPTLSFAAANILAGDIDGDGDDDLLLHSAESLFFHRTNLLLRNQGNFVFTLDAQPAFAPWDSLVPRFVDVDGDGDLDCLGWGHLISSITRFFVFRNDGSGTFTDVSAQAFPSGSATPYNVHYAIDDFDRNGRADIVVGTTIGLDLLRCDANGVFRRETAETGHFLFGLISGDIDGDGYPDLVADAAAGPFSQASLRRVVNDRSGHFAVDDTREVLAGVTTWGAHLVDLDLDGRADLLLPSGDWCRSTGTAFRVPEPLAMAFDVGSPNIADLNGDLSPDLLAAGPHPRLLLGTNRVAVDRAARASRVGDPSQWVTRLDRRRSATATVLAQYRDGRIEMVEVLRAATGERPLLRASTTAPLSPLQPASASLVDFGRNNGFEVWSEEGLIWSDGALHVGFAGGGRVDELAGSLPDPGAPVLAVGAGRLFRDDCDDVVVAIGTATQPSMLVYSLLGLGYKKIPFALPAGTRVRNIELADVDGDGDLDVVCGTAVLRHDAGSLVPMFDLGPMLSQTGAEMLPFDMDGDGDADLITSAGQLFESTPTGYRDVTLGRVPTGTQLQGASAGDIDGDGDLDIMAGNGVVLRNDGRQFTRFLGVLHAGALIDFDHSGEASVFDGNELWFNGHNRLFAPRLPQLGADYEIRITTWRQGPAATLAVVLFGSAVDYTQWPREQIALAAAQPLALPLSGGDGAAQMRVPAATALYGARFYLQAVAFDGMRAQPTNLLAEQIR